MQVPEQSLSPSWQVSAHVPPEQTWPALHLLPQAPQLPGLCCRLAQNGAPASPPPHCLRPAGQEMPHVPVAQTCPTWHLLPHAPQLSGSLSVATHELPHWVVPGPHRSPSTPGAASGAGPASTTGSLAQSSSPQPATRKQMAKQDTIKETRLSIGTSWLRQW